MKLAETSNLVLDRQQEQADFINKILGSEFSCTNTRFLGLQKKEQLISVCAYSCYQTSSIEMHVASIGRNWLTREYLYHAFYYPFVFVGVKVILGFVDSDNKAAIKFNCHLGFKEQCRIKDGAKNGDLVVLTMHKEDCRFIGVGAH